MESSKQIRNYNVFPKGWNLIYFVIYNSQMCSFGQLFKFLTTK